MLRLRTLGGLSIERPDGPTPSIGATSARRRLALLAVVAAGGAHGVPRDKLLALLWPESDADRARHALDQTIYALKRDFDSDALLLGREELLLNPAVIASDVGDFRAAITRGDFAGAVQLYTGAFLDGVFLSGAPDFERWAEEERTSLARDVETALEKLATEAARGGDHRTAVQWWQRLAARNPRRTRVVMALMSELAATGDRTSALRQAEMYNTLVKDDLDVEPNPAVAALAEKLRREPVASVSSPVQPPPSQAPRPARDARALAAIEDPVSVESSASSAQEANGADAADGREPAARHADEDRMGRRSRPRRFAVAGAGIAALLLASLAWMLAGRRSGTDRAWILPADFENRTRDSIFDRAIDAALVAGLQQSAHVNVFPRSRVQQTLVRMGRVTASSGGVPPRLDESLAREVAQREGVQVVVAGAIDRVDSNYMITVRLVDARTGEAVAAEASVAKRRADVIDAIDDLVRRLRRDIGESSEALATHDRPLPQATTRSLEALRKYADGVAVVYAGQRAAATELWREAIALDSNFALAHAELGASYYFANDRLRGDAHFERALALLDRLTDRERLLVRASAESWRGNRERAIDLRHALLAQYPGDPWAWGQIGYDYMRLGRDRDAVAALRRQLQHDSTTATVHINLATAYKGLGEYEESLRSYRRAFALQPTLLTVSNLNHEYGRSLVLAGRVVEARATFDTMRHGNAGQRAQGERSNGLLAMLQGRYGEAIERFRQATLLTQAPNNELSEARNRLFLAMAEREKGWADSARGESRAAHALFRRAYFEPTFLMYLGKALLRDGEPALAAEVFDSLVRRARPGNPTDRANLQLLAGEVALARGHADSALYMLRLSYASDSSGYAAASLARALAAAGDLAGAARMYDALAASPERWYGGEAEEFGLTAPRDAARLYERLGDTTRARAAYERVLSQWAAGDPDLVSIRESRERLARLRGGGALRPERR